MKDSKNRGIDFDKCEEANQNNKALSAPCYLYSNPVFYDTNLS